MNMNTYSVEFIIKILQNSRQYAYHATFNKHAWDYLDQLQSASNGTFTSYYNYDAEGNRTRKVVVKPGGIIEERYYLDGYEVYRKYLNNNLDLERKTINVYDVKLFDKNNDDNEDKENKSYSIDKNKKFAIVDIKTVENGTTLPNPSTIIRYQYDNHLGSACLELDELGAIISYEEYHPFGTTSYRSGRTQIEVSLKRYKYCGKERDEETGLYYYGARYYTGWTGRWISTDPLKEKYLNLTPYSYCANNSILLVDPNGSEIDDPPSKYSVTGWGHKIMQTIYDKLKLDGKASNIVTVGIMSVLQADEVNLEGKVLDKIANDPATIKYETEIIKKTKTDPRFGKEDFSYSMNKVIQMGGKRAEGDMWEQAKDPLNPQYIDTWKVATNELTWLIRSVKVESLINVNAEGKMTITHSFEDVFDLRPSEGRSEAYNTVTKISGFLYHDIIGGNDQMKVKATWQKSYQLKK